MSATALVDERTPARMRRDIGALRARALVSACAGLLAVAVVFAVLVAGHGASDQSSTTSTVIRILLAAALLPPAALLIARAPGHPIGWIIAAAALGRAVSSAAFGYATYSHAVDPLPAGVWVGWVGEWSSATIILIPAVALLLFPDGRLPSRRWRPLLWCGLASTVLIGLSGALGPGDDLEFQGNPFLPESTAKSLGDLMGSGWLLLVPAVVGGVVAITRRLRRAEGQEAEQLRLLRAASVVVAIGFGACFAGSLIAPAAFDLGAAGALLSLVGLSGAMAFGILRHRLFGLDVYVNRALVITVSAVVLGALYVCAVLGASALLGLHTPLGPALAATAIVTVLFQPLRTRLQRGVDRLAYGDRDDPYAAIATLGSRLGAVSAPEQVLPVMAETIAESLRVPYVAVEVGQELDGPAAVYGSPAAGIALRVPLDHGGRRVGSLLVGARAHGEPLDVSDRRLLSDIARPAGAALSAVALSLELQHSRERLVSAREEERRRLRGDLHDGLGPTLAGAVLTIEAARRIIARDPAKADELLERAGASVEGTVAEVRRVVYELRPPALDQLGLVGALGQQATTLRGAAGLRCDIAVRPDPLPPLPAAVEVAAFRIVQEALTNVARHAEARRVSVSLAADRRLAIEVRDDGRGIGPSTAPGVGLTSMRERAAELGGHLEIAAAQGGGTLLRAQLPLL